MELLNQVDEKISLYLRDNEIIRNNFQKNILEDITKEYSKTITSRVLRGLEDIRGISLPNYSDLNEKVENTLMKETDIYISVINTFFKNQRSIVDATTTTSKNFQFPKFKEDLFKEFTMDLEKKFNIYNELNKDIPNEVISKLVTHISFRNQETSINQHSDKIEIEIRKIVHEEYEKFNADCNTYSMNTKSDIINTNHNFFNEIEKEKKIIDEMNNNYEPMYVDLKEVLKPNTGKPKEVLMNEPYLSINDIKNSSSIESVEGLNKTDLKTDKNLNLTDGIFGKNIGVTGGTIEQNLYGNIEQKFNYQENIEQTKIR